MKELMLFNIHHNCLTLSPEPSTVFYAEGCRFHCNGCLYWEGHDKLKFFNIAVDDAVDTVIEHKSQCIVLSGGNPLLQAEPFLEMVEKVKAIKDVGLIIYCGETREELDAMTSVDCPEARLLAHADIIISGRYEPENDVGNAMVGSSNQHVEFVTTRYSAYKELYEVRDRKIEVEFSYNEPGMSYSGVPTAAQRRFFSRMGQTARGDSIPACPRDVSVYHLSVDTFMLAMEGASIAIVELGEERVRITIKPIRDDQIDSLIKALLYLLGGEGDV